MARPALVISIPEGSVRPVKVSGIAGAVLFLFAATLFAAQDADPQFEIASLRHIGDTASTRIRDGKQIRSNLQPLRFTPTSVSCRVTLMALLTDIYQVVPFQIEAPEWTRAEVYQIDARMPDGTSRETARLMLEELLKQRLGLHVHHASRSTAVYLLVEIPGANKLQAVEDAPRQSYRTLLVRDGYLAIPAIPLDVLAADLSFNSDKLVLNETGRTGFNKVKVQWARVEYATASILNEDLIAALPQLRLKLQPAKRDLEYIVVDRIYKEPTTN
ncbi:MAG TPA: TIGR03435 family protein [Candidatus Limnocylindrales bacterium]|nr:TIGR03435 family protein [Candidatus Limnocylindrales bacterium]